MHTMIITGVTSGIGKALVDHFVLTHHVIGIGRDKAKLTALKQALHAKDHRYSFEMIEADFLDLETVEAAVKTIKKHHKHIDVIINNAALVAKSLKSKQGLDAQFQVNHVAGVMLMEGLMPLLTQDSLVIYTSSEMHQQTTYSMPFTPNSPNVRMLKAYRLTKLYNLLTVDYYNQHASFVSTALHPGLVKTSIGQKYTKGFFAFMWKLWTLRARPPQDTVFGYACLVNRACLVKDHFYYHDGLAIKQSKHVNHQNAEALMQYTLALLSKKEEHHG